MPNWCMNDITITGPKEVISEMYNGAVEKGGLFEGVVPIGEWEYNKALEAWGTKWDVDPEQLEYSEDGSRASIYGCVDTAQGPPIKFYDTVLANNKDFDIEATYHEPGMCFIGMYEDGEEFYYEYDLSDPSSLENIPESLIEAYDIQPDEDLDYFSEDHDEY